MQSHTTNNKPVEAIAAYFDVIESELNYITVLAKETARNLGSLCSTVQGMIDKTQYLRSVVTDSAFGGVADYKAVWGSIDAIHSAIAEDLKQLNDNQIAALQDKNLSAENERLVCASYQEAINKFKALFDTVEQLRWDFLEAEADSEGQESAAYGSVDELLTALTA